MSKAPAPDRDRARAGVDRWAYSWENSRASAYQSPAELIAAVSTATIVVASVGAEQFR